MKFFCTLALVGCFLLAFPLGAQRKREMRPWDLSTYTCEAHLKVVKDAPALARFLGFWVHGYVSGLQGADVKAKPIDRDTIQSLTGKVEAACGSDGKKLLVDALKEIK